MRSETEFYKITVYRAWTSDGKPQPVIRLDPKCPYDTAPRFYTHAHAREEIEALITGVGMAEELLRI